MSDVGDLNVQLEVEVEVVVVRRGGNDDGDVDMMGQKGGVMLN